MGNFLKYSTSQPTKEGLRRGNLVLGTGEDEEYGPTSTTGYLNSLNIPAGGWVVYTLGLNNTPIGWIANDSNELFSISATLGGTGTSVTNVDDAVAYICGLENTWILDSAPSNIITNGLIYYADAGILSSYPHTRTAVMDVSGNAVDSDNGLTNGVTWVSGNGGSLEFDGTDDYFEIMSNGFGTFNQQEFSINMWFNVDVVNNYNVLFSYDKTAHSNPYYANHIRTNSDGSILFGFNQNGSNWTGVSAPGGTVTAGNWYNVCVTYQEGSQQIFVGGELINSVAKSGPIVYYNQEVWIGRSNFGSGYFNGKIPIVQYYNRVLTGDEVQQNYAEFEGRFS